MVAEPTLLQRIELQLPAQVRPLVEISVLSDPFLLAPVVRFKARNGTVIEETLREDLVVSDTTVAKLCLL